MSLSQLGVSSATTPLQSLLEYHMNSYSRKEYSDSARLQKTVSFIVPVYNSENTITECVESITSQTNAEIINEIILVEDASTDSSPRILRQLSEKYPKIKVISNSQNYGAATSRNRGIQNATGDLVCFIDSDIILPHLYMRKHVLQHQTDENVITFSLRQNVFQSTKSHVRQQVDFRKKLLTHASDLQSQPFQFCDSHTLAELCLTCAVTYNRKDLLKVKGCPENFTGWGFNDTALAAKVIALNKSVVPMYDAEVIHVEHAPRSGSNKKKWKEFDLNKERYNRMLSLPFEQTCRTYIPELEAPTSANNQLIEQQFRHAL